MKVVIEHDAGRARALMCPITINRKFAIRISRATMSVLKICDATNSERSVDLHRRLEISEKRDSRHLSRNTTASTEKNLNRSDNMEMILTFDFYAETGYFYCKEEPCVLLNN